MARILTPEPPEKEPENPEEAAHFREAAGLLESEKQRALAEPGPSWRDWWYYSASKWYMVLLFLLVDVWGIFTWTEVGLWIPALVTAVLLVYAEFLLYQYLYHRPRTETRRRREPFRRNWFRPVEFGRWTPEGTALRSGGTLPSSDEGPSPDEFF